MGPVAWSKTAIRCGAAVVAVRAPRTALAVDHNHPPPCDLTDPAPREHRQRAIQPGSINAGDQFAQRGLPPEPCPARVGSDAPDPGGASIQPDCPERAGTGEHRTDRNREHPSVNG